MARDEVYVKQQPYSDRADYFQFYRLDFHSDNSFTAWPLPSYGLLQIGSRSYPNADWPEGLRVVRKAKELRQCREWDEKAQDKGRMKFHCSRMADGRIHVLNVVQHYMGQEHEHSPEEFEAWKANAIQSGSRESDFIWS